MSARPASGAPNPGAAQPNSPTHPLHFASEVLSAKDAFRLVRIAARDKQPFSMLRFGDGEGLFLGTGSARHEERQTILNTWFGSRVPPEEDLANLAERVKTAFRSADLLGLATNPRPDTLFYQGVCAAYFHDIVRSTAAITDAILHIRIYKSGELDNFLTRRRYVGLITGRNVGEWLQKKYEIKKVEQIMVPEEAAHGFAEGAMVHYPDRFREIQKLIKPPFPGAVYLVGAGLLGKIYCDIIKRRGGVAVDIGSIFDIWAGQNTRKYMDLIEMPAQTALAQNHPLLLSKIGELQTPEEYFETATELLEMRRFPLATTVLLWGTVLFPDDAKLREQLAKVLERTGYSDRAVQEARMCLKLNPTSTTAMAVVARGGERPRGSALSQIVRRVRRS